jgi:metal-responsive CopG/Arc/MetJ family transcriptional regulator
MRATIEIPDELRAVIMALAAKKGYRGYSRIIQEAIMFYLKEKAPLEDGLSDLIALKGSWNTQDAEDIRSNINQLRKNWD